MKLDYYEIVETVLRSDVEARNDDKKLIVGCLKELGLIKNNMLSVSADDLDKLPSFETITRIRRKIQNEEKRFIPTWANVLVKREFSEDTVKAVFGDSSNEYKQYIFIKSEGMRFKR